MVVILIYRFGCSVSRMNGSNCVWEGSSVRCAAGLVGLRDVSRCFTVGKCIFGVKHEMEKGCEC